MRHRLELIELGIIPARAGFTHGRVAVGADPADHPRSRGVYAAAMAAAMADSGSSPLARGLRRRRGDGRRPARIIPARAGFTAATCGCSTRRAGSSPLARGLRRGRRAWTSRAGIIPARAGFTHGPLLRVSHHGDHPRSRGVYVAVHDSVLAHEMDHPRSRGVYRGSTSLLTPLLGSSPLARGLRVPLGRAAEHVRIIPARAGFTTAAACPRRASWDHPRSRGVYHSHAPASSRAGGSSPLARGLLLVGPSPLW